MLYTKIHIDIITPKGRFVNDLREIKFVLSNFVAFNKKIVAKNQTMEKDGFSWSKMRVFLLSFRLCIK